MPLRLSVSATTRRPRPYEKDGKDYYFWTQEQFEQHRRAGEFLETACVHGHWYGTLRSEVEGYRAQGLGVILDIDVQGARRIKQLYPESLSIFLRTEHWETYEQRLRQRGTEDEATIARRLATAREELRHQDEFEWVVFNEDLQTAVNLVRDLIHHAFQKEANVLDELKEEGIVNKVGGRFKLSTLIQKRMVALNTGARPLVDMPPQQRNDKMAIVIQEILQDKIYLDASNQVQARGLSANDAARRAMLGDISADLGSGGDD